MKNLELKQNANLPQGFKAAGARVGLKKRDNKDMAMIISEPPAAVAGVFTTNQVQSATVKLCQKVLESRTARGVVINSGNANACTGEQGIKDAIAMGEACAEHLGGEPDDYMVCSTGHIGMFLPMDIILPGIETLSQSLAEGSAQSAAEGILTTDTYSKTLSADIAVDGKPVRITGIAKGAGMIEPNMATMLAFLFTDAHVDADDLQTCLSSAVDQSFNRITVDGDQSTNDTVLFFANGAAGNGVLTERHPDWRTFQDAVDQICFGLAMMIVRDGEGASKLVTIRVRGALSDEEADAGARAIGNSLLVKTSWGGKFAIWGRLMDSIGYSACTIDETKVDIDYNDTPAVRNGLDAGSPTQSLSDVIGLEEFTIDVNLNLGQGSAVLYTCEISRDYVKINEK